MTQGGQCLCQHCAKLSHCVRTCMYSMCASATMNIHVCITFCSASCAPFPSHAPAVFKPVNHSLLLTATHCYSLHCSSLTATTHCYSLAATHPVHRPVWCPAACSGPHPSQAPAGCGHQTPAGTGRGTAAAAQHLLTCAQPRHGPAYSKQGGKGGQRQHANENPAAGILAPESRVPLVLSQKYLRLCMYVWTTHMTMALQRSCVST